MNLPACLAVCLLAALLTGCPPLPPVPPGPDASDAQAATETAPPPVPEAAPPPTPDAGPPPSTCAQACQVLAHLCGDDAGTCTQALALVDQQRAIRSESGAPVSCSCIAAATTKAAVIACGVGCP